MIWIRKIRPLSMTSIFFVDTRREWSMPLTTLCAVVHYIDNYFFNFLSKLLITELIDKYLS